MLRVSRNGRSGPLVCFARRQVAAKMSQELLLPTPQRVSRESINKELSTLKIKKKFFSCYGNISPSVHLLNKLNLSQFVVHTDTNRNLIMMLGRS